MTTYEMIIGLEVHVELSTQTKIFCACTTQFGGAPNTHCCPICMGFPGTLPRLNRRVVDFAIATGVALGCHITRKSTFERKNYFYPDLPKAYQISQLYSPLCTGGQVDINPSGAKKSIRIHEIHMEEDAGKLLHDTQTNQTRIDYNRAGVPLLEIVSEPDLRSAEETIAYLEALRSTLQYLGVSDCKMNEGSLRVDVNLSVRPVGKTRLGTRTEMKNLNSFRAIARAIAAEYKRQVACLEGGNAVLQETRRWDDAQGLSVAMRQKADARDYRYFPDPDLPPLVIDDAWIDRIRAAQPELMDEKRTRYQREFSLSAYDATLLTLHKPLADLFERTTALCHRPKDVANWLMGEMMALLKERMLSFEEITMPPEALARIITLVSEGRINRQSAREIFSAAFDAPLDVDDYVKKHALGMEEGGQAYEEAIAQVLHRCAPQVETYHSGKANVFGFLVGQTMKALDGKGDPKKIQALLKKALDDMH